MVARIDWQAAAEAGDMVELVALIAGCPYLLTRDGVSMTSVTWTDGADPAWHAGASPTTRGWLDLDAFQVEEKIRPVDGTLDVSGFTLRLADIDGDVTAYLSSRDALPLVLLGADMSATATTIVVQSTGPFAASGVLHIGRERITYSGKTSSSFTGCTRGTAGTKARPYYRVQRPRIFGGEFLPSTIGRRVTVWAVRKIAGTWTDPSLIYDGRVASGLRMSDAGAAWEIPVDHAAKALDEKTTPTQVQVYGYSHFAPERRTHNGTGRPTPFLSPVIADWSPLGGVGDIVFLTDESGAPDYGGWSPSRDEFIARFNQASVAQGAGIGLNTSSVQAGWSTDRRLIVSIAWGGGASDPADSDSARTSARVDIGRMPDACVWMRDKLHLDDADLAVIPAVPSSSHGVFPQWGLEAERDNGLVPKGMLRALLGSVSGSVVDVSALATTTTETGTGILRQDAHALITRPTLASLRLFVNVQATTAGWWDAVRYGIIEQIDSFRGLDHLTDSFAWDRIASTARGQQPWGVERRYWIAPEDAPLAVLRNEATLSGLVLATWRGRLSVARVREVSPSEEAAYTFGQTDLRRGSICSLREASDGIVSSVRYILSQPGDENEAAVRIVDGAAQTEAGTGAEITARVPEGAIPGGAPTALLTDQRLRGLVERVALATIAPWTRPYAMVTVPTDLRAAGVEVGDIVSLTEFALPNGGGSRGVAQRGVVVGHRRDYRAGRVDLFVRVAAPRAGWAPAYLLSSISGTDCVVNGDPCGVGGNAGFAGDYMADGSLRTDAGVSYLSPGDAVRIIELDTRTPASAYTADVVSVDPATRTITLSGSPGATWASRASGGTAMLVPAIYPSATTGQRQFVYIASGSTFTIASGVYPRRWA